MARACSPTPRRRPHWPSLPSVSAAALLLAASWLPTATAQTAADYFVTSLPGAPDPLLEMYAGHIEITPEHHGNLFFWLFKNRHIADRSRTVLWLNGGPGCSSLDGALMEVGPYRVETADGGARLRLQEGSWDEFANVVFVDNPVGTGFSYVDGDSYVHELSDMAAQMVTFLERFFKTFPELAHHDLYIAGESYAGQHIPYIAQAILDRNAKNTQHAWNLSGLMIGNGWISGPDQYISYIPFAYENNLIQSGSDQERQLLQQQEICVKALEKDGKDHVDVTVCEVILQEMLRVTSNGNSCVNMYDVRLHDNYPSCGMNWPPDLQQVTPYLRRQDVIEALHINADKKTGWTECSGQVSNNFRALQSKPSKTLLPGLLEQMPIVLFSGDKDLICNHIGTENLINNMAWNNGTGMETAPGVWAPMRDWTFEGAPAGTWQEARNLTYIRFYNSSHMVPFDYPRRTRDMLDRFMGVDIASIGGTPADSRIDGEKAHPETSVGGHPNSTLAQQAEKDKVKAATWRAYRQSGEAALAVVVVVVAVATFFIVRGRRRRQGYQGVFTSDPYEASNGRSGLPSGLGLDGGSVRAKWREHRDVEAARDFDEAELDDLTERRDELLEKRRRGDMEVDRFELHDEDEEEDELGTGRADRHAS